MANGRENIGCLCSNSVLFWEFFYFSSPARIFRPVGLPSPWKISNIPKQPLCERGIKPAFGSHKTEIPDIVKLQFLLSQLLFLA